MRTSNQGCTRAIVLTTAFLSLLLFSTACGEENYKCHLDCRDVTEPLSAYKTVINDIDCDVCRTQFEEVRAAVCGLDENPNCMCSYNCESLWEWKYG